MHSPSKIRALSHQVLSLVARPNSAVDALHYAVSGFRGVRLVRNWIPQIVIGIIVTVVGTVIADSIARGLGHRHFFDGSHFSGSARSGR